MRFSTRDSIELYMSALVELSTGIHEPGSTEKTEPSSADKLPAQAFLHHSPFLPQSTSHPLLPLALLPHLVPQGWLGFEVLCRRIQGPQLPHPPELSSLILVQSKVQSSHIRYQGKAPTKRVRTRWRYSHRNEVALHLLKPRPKLLHLHHQFLHLFLNVFDQMRGISRFVSPPDISAPPIPLSENLLPPVTLLPPNQINNVQVHLFLPILPNLSCRLCCAPNCSHQLHKVFRPGSLAGGGGGGG